MTSLDIVQQRLHNQHLIGAPFARPDQVGHWFGAVQAQEYPGATWGIAQRLDGVTQTTIDQAYADGAILRTHAMRPTWHFVTPADIRWLLALTSPRVRALLAYNDHQLEIDKVTLKKSDDVLAKTLQGGKQLTRLELGEALQKNKINTDDLRLTHL